MKVNYHHKYVTIKKSLADEGQINKFLCFGGGRTSLQSEYQRDTYCIDGDHLKGNVEDGDDQANMSMASYHSKENVD